MVEFLMAAFIFAIGLLGLLALQTGAVAQATAGRGRVTASYIANLILQQAQTEGQYFYYAKASVITANPAFTPVFTIAPGTAVATTPFGGFNVDGVQVTGPTGANVANLATLVPDANKRNPVFQANWIRRAYQGTAPVSSNQTQEFVVNIAWVEGTQNKFLSVSRNIRY